MRLNIVDEIKEEIMLFLKDQRYETDLIFIKKFKGETARLRREVLRSLGSLLKSCELL